MLRLARIAAALVLGAGIVLLPTAAVAAPVPPAAVATFTVLSEWPAGYVGGITIRNDTGSTITGWRVDFDLAPGTRMISSWNGEFTRAGDHYTVTNHPWNGTLAPGASITIGWVAEGHAKPVNCLLNGANCAGAPLDRTPPTRPGPLVIDFSTGVTLTWGPSTDDQGPVRYEVYLNGQLRTTVGDTRYVYSTGAILPPMIYIFGVRAVDPAGNPSPLVYRTIGQVWRGDEIPEPPSGLRVTTAAAGLLRLSWTAPPASTQISVPPVAGYEVYLDGEPIGQTGATSLVVAVPAPGTHTFGVRTINAVDRYSPAAEVTHAAG